MVMLLTCLVNTIPSKCLVKQVFCNISLGGAKDKGVKTAGTCHALKVGTKLTIFFYSFVGKIVTIRLKVPRPAAILLYTLFTVVKGS